MDLLTTFYYECLTPSFTVQRLQYYLTNGISPNVQMPDGTPLLTAMYLIGNRPIVRVLIRERADPLDERGPRDILPFLVLRNGDKEMLKYLLKYALDINQTYDDYSTLTHYAVKGILPVLDSPRTVPIEMLDVLLEFKPDLEICNTSGLTPLLMTESQSIILKLVNAGASVLHKDKSGHTIRQRLRAKRLLTKSLNRFLEDREYIQGLGMKSRDFRRDGDRKVLPEIMDDTPECRSRTDLERLTVVELKELIQWYNDRALADPMNKTGAKIELIRRINVNVPKIYILEFLMFL